MVKILSQSGDSLADLYDVEGSIAGIDNLETRELPIVHEMGATIFAERLSGFVRRITTGALLQSVSYNAVITNLPAHITRILGVQVVADTGGRVSLAAVSIQQENGEREIPIYIFDSTNDSESQVRFIENEVLATFESLNPGVVQVPSLLIGSPQRQRVNQIALRGTTLAFGAGDVTITALIYIGFTHIGEISSRGLPVPSW